MICPWSVAAAAVTLLLLSPGKNQMVRVSAQPTKTRCVVDTCGDVGVPYPFGIDGGSCSFLPGFNLTCDRTKQPHRLFLGDGSHLQVTEISLANYTVRVLNGVGTVNFTFARHNDSTATSAGVSIGQDDGPYIVSEEHNQLVVTGCNIMASLLGNSRSNVIIGCSSFCSITDWWGAEPIVHSGAGGACSGLGCCDVNITIGRPSYDLQLRWLDWDHNYDHLLPIAVRIAERGWFDGMSTKLLRKNSRSAVPVPVVLEWAVASVHMPPTPVDVNSTCPKDPARSECRSSNSFCRNIANMYRSGYMCKCDDGYQGNPYLTGGCEGTCILPPFL